ncbi:MCE family protein [Nonomuraea sp. NPDC050663]|uniref:MCE family protein n=1 Tax=Nonomuraea sp. NPDC050663 TaxID=3364370 RepID=UPI003792998F
MNPAPLGLASVAVVVAAVVVALGVRLPSGAAYSAHFAESAGLRPGEPVLIAGVRVGEVEAVELDGARVRVDLRVEDAVALGSATRAHIRLATLLGSHSVVLEPGGPGRLAGPIPLTRTSVPYEIVPAVGDVTRSADRLDAGALRRAMQVLATTIDGSSEEIRSSLDGLGRLARTVSERDDSLHELVRHAERVTGLLGERRERLSDLAADGDLLLREILARRAVIHSLLINTVALTGQIDGLIADNRARLGPALRELRSFVALLRRNEENLDRTLRLLVPYTRQFADAVGNGRWFDAIVQNLVPLPAGAGPDPSLGGLVP